MSDIVMADEVVRVGVGTVIRRGDEVLLIKRRNVHGDGTWSTPGGHIEFGESLEQCAAREAEEETGLVVGDVTFLAITNDHMPAEGKHYVTVWMECSYAGDEPRVGADYEMSEVGWFGVEALPSPLFAPFERLVRGDALGDGARR